MMGGLLHGGVRIGCAIEARRFARALKAPEATQRARLAEILEVLGRTPSGHESGLSRLRNYEAYAAALPVTEYGDWKGRIERQRAGEPTLARKVERFEPTSGSTGERKWIPYTPEFLREMNRAAKAWIFDLYRTFPALARGPHFWSLSWVPTELRSTLNTNDVELFPAWQRAFLSRIIAAHPALPHADSSEAAWWATKLLLASQGKLSFISAWSPTYASALLREIFSERKEIADALKSRRWGRHAKALARFTPPSRAAFPADAEDFGDFVRRAWPRLALISAWDSAASRPFADELRRLLPAEIPLQGKGLWATEGVVTIPWRGAFPLAVRSHFYEFRILSTGEIRAAWELSLGDEVQPILTTSSGLLRYALSDRMRVSGFLERTPTFEFLGRLGGVDLVGEKMGFAKAEEILKRLRTDFPAVEIVGLGAGKVGSKARYSVLAVGPSAGANGLAEALERELLTVHHYALSRELHQMLPAHSIFRPSLAELDPFLERNPIKGQNKPSPIVVLPDGA
jgi:hypothetical protein